MKAQLKANKKYLSKMDDIKIRVPQGRRDELKKIAIEKGYNGMQPYILDLIKKDTGIDFSETVSQETK